MPLGGRKEVHSHQEEEASLTDSYEAESLLLVPPATVSVWRIGHLRPVETEASRLDITVMEFHLVGTTGVSR